MISLFLNLSSLTSVLAEEPSSHFSENYSHTFRNQFLKSLDPALGSEESLIAQPQLLDTMLNIPFNSESETPQDFFAKIIKATQEPSHYFSGPIQDQNDPIKDPSIPSQNPLNFEEPPLLILFSGVFSEFTKVHPFEETLKNDSPLKAEILSKIKALKSTDTRRTDPQYRLEKLKTTQQPLEKLLLVGALKNKEGQILANTLVTNTAPMSLESLGDFNDNAINFHRRLSKFFSILNRTPKRIALIGYSRGAVVSLQVLSLVHQNYDFCKRSDYNYAECTSSLTWSSNIKSYVSLAGVLYGSELADYVYGDHQNLSSMNKALKALKKLGDDLHIIHAGPIRTTRLFIENLKTWKSFFTSIMRLKVPDWNPPENQGKLSLRQAYFKWKKSQNHFDQQDNLNLRGVIEMANDIAFEHLTMRGTIHDYNNNIQRLKNLISAALSGTNCLTTNARLKWWSENTIPPEIRYFSVAGTIIDAPPQSPMENPLSYNIKNPEFKGTKKTFKYFAEKLGIPFNDGAVGFNKTFFLPQLATLNPHQPPLEMHPLALVQTHHKGLVFEAVATSKKDLREPFPRENLLETLTQTIFID
jgi:hypothetical protein